jgi:hypothetical protein
MPPKKRLPPEVIADFVSWVKAGAPWPDKPSNFNASTEAARRHWAFQPLGAIVPPPDPDGNALTPVDRFLAAKLRPKGIQPVARADKRTLIRRATFDLTGLPPTPGAIATM